MHEERIKAKPLSVVLLVACFNRKQKTLHFFESLISGWPQEHRLTIVMTDDGSTDGTAEAVKANFPTVQIVHGSGTLFWNGAMSRMMASTLKRDFNAVILANDDIKLDADVLRRFINKFAELQISEPSVLVGSFKDEGGQGASYSGMKRPTKRGSPLTLNKIFPNGKLQKCDTFNGNFTAIPTEPLRAIGGMDASYTQGFGDLDLGYRLANAGVPLLVYSEFLGSCDANDLHSIKKLKSLRLGERWHALFIHGNWARDYRKFVIKHSPLLSPILSVRMTKLFGF